MERVITTDLKIENIERAAEIIDPVFRESPQFIDEQLCEALGRRVVVKVETVNPIRSFKGRGADFAMSTMDPKKKVVCASAGNFGQAVAYAGRRRGMAVEVFVPTDVNPAKLVRMRSLGAIVTVVGSDFADSKEAAREKAQREAGCVFLEDGGEAAISEGAGTIGMELLRRSELDVIVLPVGDGALITGVGTWVKHASPQTKIIGVCAQGSPAMLESWRTGKAVESGRTDTIADGIAVSAPIARSVERMLGVVDEMLLVDDAQMIEAMRLAATTLGVLLEPAGAAGLAAVRMHAIAGERIATVLTGGNVHPELVGKILG